MQIPDDHKLVSFDVKSLFTPIPHQLALDCTENAVKDFTVELPQPKDDIMHLLNFTNSYTVQLWALHPIFCCSNKTELCKTSRNKP